MRETANLKRSFKNVKGINISDKIYKITSTLTLTLTLQSSPSHVMAEGTIRRLVSDLSEITKDSLGKTAGRRREGGACIPLCSYLYASYSKFSHLTIHMSPHPYTVPDNTLKS